MHIVRRDQIELPISSKRIGFNRFELIGTVNQTVLVKCQMEECSAMEEAFLHCLFHLCFVYIWRSTYHVCVLSIMLAVD